MHPAGCRELSHACIHERVAGHPARQASSPRRSLQGNSANSSRSGTVDMSRVVVEHVIGELAPRELTQEGSAMSPRCLSAELATGQRRSRPKRAEVRARSSRAVRGGRAGRRVLEIVPRNAASRAWAAGSPGPTNARCRGRRAAVVNRSARPASRSARQASGAGAGPVAPRPVRHALQNGVNTRRLRLPAS